LVTKKCSLWTRSNVQDHRPISPKTNHSSSVFEKQTSCRVAIRSARTRRDPSQTCLDSISTWTPTPPPYPTTHLPYSFQASIRCLKQTFVPYIYRETPSTLRSNQKDVEFPLSTHLVTPSSNQFEWGSIGVTSKETSLPYKPLGRPPRCGAENRDSYLAKRISCQIPNPLWGLQFFIYL
jgi:hypothetical protein